MELPLDHVAIAVRSIAEAQPVFEALTGGSGTAREHVEAQAVDVVFIGRGDAGLELIEPTDPSSGVARFLDKRGPGLHHVAFRVRDLDSVLARLAANGVRLIDHTPRRGARGHRTAFIHPTSCGGVLVELLECAAAE